MYAVAAAVAFLLELCALAALGYWGAYAGNGAWAYVLAVATPLAAAIVWGCSPRRGRGSGLPSARRSR